MERYKQGESRDQLSIIPTNFDDMIAADNDVRILNLIVQKMDIPSLSCKYSKTANTGRKPYNPEDMFKLYVYSYFDGIRSSRKIERECSRNIEVMWLINNLRPDTDSMNMVANNGGHDIAYNVQIGVEAKNNIVVAVEATNEGMDYMQLHNISKQSKEALNADSIISIADRGYYSAEEFRKCKSDGILPVVPKALKGKASDPAFWKSNFTYDKKNDVYVCPRGEALPKMKHRSSNESYYIYRNSKACKIALTVTHVPLKLTEEKLPEEHPMYLQTRLMNLQSKTPICVA